MLMAVELCVSRALRGWCNTEKLGFVVVFLGCFDFGFVVFGDMVAVGVQLSFGFDYMLVWCFDFDGILVCLWTMLLFVWDVVCFVGWVV